MIRCVVLDNGILKCFGRNFDGQLGMGDTEDRGDEVLGRRRIDEDPNFYFICILQT